MKDELLTVQEVALMLKVNKDWVYDAIASGRLNSVRLGARCLRVRASDLNQMIEEGVSQRQRHPAFAGRVAQLKR